MATMMAMAIAKTFTPEQIKTMAAATIIGPTARLTDSEAVARAEELRLRSHSTYMRRYKAASDTTHRKPEFVVFARDWQRYVDREGGCAVD